MFIVDLAAQLLIWSISCDALYWCRVAKIFSFCIGRRKKVFHLWRWLIHGLVVLWLIRQVGCKLKKTLLNTAMVIELLMDFTWDEKAWICQQLVFSKHTQKVNEPLSHSGPKIGVIGRGWGRLREELNAKLVVIRVNDWLGLTIRALSHVCYHLLCCILTFYLTCQM